MSVLNLPREERYKRENMLVVGLIPGPREPTDMRLFLKALVDDLVQLWHGVTFTSLEGKSHLTRAALLCVACDIPATRKVSGYPGHSAALG